MPCRVLNGTAIVVLQKNYKKMIKIKLLLEAYMRTCEDLAKRNELRAAQSLYGLVSQLDSKAEEIPSGDYERLVRLFTSLKGSELDKEEKDVLLEIANF